MIKYKHFCFSFFDFDIWVGREWEITMNFLQIGQRSLFQIGAGKNYQTVVNLFFFNIIGGE